MLRLFAVLALVIAVQATPALAAHHHHRHHARAAHLKHHAHHHRRAAYRHRHARARARARSPITTASANEPLLVRIARSTVGDTATQLGVRATLWCMAAVNKWLEKAGLHGTGSDVAKSALALGPHVGEPRVGALAVMSRRGGGHVGIVSGVDANGNPIVISGNHGHVVAESMYPRGRVIAYVLLPGAG